MVARNGEQYLESLKANQPEVYLNCQRVADVITEPVFSGPLDSIMQQYDLQVGGPSRRLLRGISHSR